MGFINFHNHSEYSFLSSLLKVEDLVSFAVYHSFKGCALTDTFSTYGFIKLTGLCRSEGIRPVYGLEIFIKGINGKNQYHINLIALNNAGLENLFRLNTLIHQNYINENHYEISLENLIHCKEGLAILAESELIKNMISSQILEETIECYQKHFKNNFYVEVNYTGGHKIQEIKDLLNVIDRYNLNAIASCEARYFLKDKPAFDILINSSHKNPFIKEINSHLSTEFDYSLKNKEDFYLIFKNHINLIDNSEILFQKIETDFNVKSFKIPVLYKNSFEKVKHICSLRLKNFCDREEYRNRLDAELDMLYKMKISDIFLIIFDTVHFLKKKKIPYGYGNGSACSSLILFLLGITKVDPVKYNLLFESFLNLGKLHLPEIIIEIAWEKRNLIFSFLSSKYGRQNVSYSASIHHSTARSLINEFSDYFKLNHDKINKIKSLIPSVYNYFLENKMSDNRFLYHLIKEERRMKDFYDNDPDIHDFFDYIIKIEGLISHSSIHSGSIIIIPEGINKYSSLEYTLKRNNFAQIPNDDLEDTGIFKIDILGLHIISVINETMRRSEIKIIPDNDQNTFDLLAEGNTTAVFQLESNITRELLKKLKPQSINEISDIIALCRPVSFKSGLTEKYINHKNQKLNFNKVDELDSIASDTHGLFIYQEQLLRLMHEKAGLDWDKIENLKKSLFTKNNTHIITLKDEIIQSCVSNGLEFEQANRLFAILVDFGSFSINKAHSTVYALYAYTCAYLKNHHPLEYYISSINNNHGNEDRINRYLMDLRFHNKIYLFHTLSIDINYSKTLCSKENGNIRCGLAFVKYVGTKLSREIVRERNKNGEYKDFIDFYFRLKDRGLHLKSIEFLIKAGVFDKYGYSRKLLLSILPDISSFFSKKQSNEEGSLFTDYSSIPEIKTLINRRLAVQSTGDNNLNNFNDSKEDKFRFEFEATDLFISHHPLDRYLDYLKEHQFDKIENLDRLSYGSFIGYLYKIRSVKTRNGSTMAFSQFSDRTGSTEVVFFPKVYLKFLQILKNNIIYLIKGKIDGEKIIAEQVFLFETIIDGNS